MSGTMDSRLFIHDEEIKSIFRLLGKDENDLSYSLGYVLSKSRRFLKVFIEHIWRKKIKISDVQIRLQQAGIDGYTDFELVVNNEYMIIIEAKKGWVIPEKRQIKKYLKRFKKFDKRKRLFTVLSECKESYFNNFIKNSMYNIPIRPVTWEDTTNLIDDVLHEVTNKEKFVLNEFRKYIREVINMETHESNWVYVVSIKTSEDKSWLKISWSDVINKKKHYWYPHEKNWPKVPPNYMAFRYYGKLQSIHHVEKYEVIADMHDEVPEVKKGKMKNHYLLWLGPPLEPMNKIPNGNIYPNGRLWAYIDTLFTSKTIKEAVQISKKRENKIS